MVAATDSLGKTTRVAYDGVGNVVGVTRKDGTVATMAYDEVDRLMSRTLPALPGVPSDVVTMEYDVLNNPVRIADTDSVIANVFGLKGSVPENALRYSQGLTP